MSDIKPVQTASIVVRQGSETLVGLGDRVVNFAITEVISDSELPRLTADGSWKDTKVRRPSDYTAVNA